MYYCNYLPAPAPALAPALPPPPLYYAIYNYYTSKKGTDGDIVVLINRDELDGSMVAVMAPSVVGQET